MEKYGKLIIAERLKNSTNGNPRYLVALATDDGGLMHAKTEVDSSLGYSIGNHAGERVKATFRYLRGYLHVIDVEPVKGGEKVA